MWFAGSSFAQRQEAFRAGPFYATLVGDVTWLRQVLLSAHRLARKYSSAAAQVGWQPSTSRPVETSQKKTGRETRPAFSPLDLQKLRSLRSRVLLNHFHDRFLTRCTHYPLDFLSFAEKNQSGDSLNAVALCR